MNARIGMACVVLVGFGCVRRVDADHPPAKARAYQLLAAVPPQETANFALKMPQAEIDTTEHDRTPRIVGTGETQLIRLDGQRARIYGDRDGREGWSVDNVVLFEVVNASGQVINRVVSGFSEGVLVDHERVDSVGRLSFTFDPGEVDLTSHLPEAEPFKLRATALDYFGLGKVSDVFLVLEDGPRSGGSDDDLRTQ